MPTIEDSAFLADPEDDIRKAPSPHGVEDASNESHTDSHATTRVIVLCIVYKTMPQVLWTVLLTRPNHSSHLSHEERIDRQCKAFEPSRQRILTVSYFLGWSGAGRSHT